MKINNYKYYSIFTVIFLICIVGLIPLTIIRNLKIPTSTPTPNKVAEVIPSTVSTRKITPTITPIKTTATKTPTKNGYISFHHPVINYTLEYPKDWKSDQYDGDFYIRTKDYQESDDESESHLKSGAGIYVFTEKAQSKSIDEEFNNSYGSKLAKSKTYTKVDNLKAIQFDYSEEGTSATMTQFIKNDTLYTVKYRYISGRKNTSYMNVYTDLLKSFKTN